MYVSGKRDTIKLINLGDYDMASKGDKKVMNKKIKWIIGGVVGFLVVIIGLVVIFGVPSAEFVFKGMNEEMLKVKSVTVDQEFAIKDTDGKTSNVSSKVFLNLASDKELLAKGNFALDINSNGLPMSIGGDIIKVGDSSYVKYSEFSSSSSKLKASFSEMETKLKNNWIKVRENDSFVDFAKMPIEFATGIMPTPFANLDSTQRKNVLAILQDKKMYIIEESSKVDIAGVSAYKYSITFDNDQYKKAADAIAGYVSYFKSSDKDSEMKNYTVWVNIATKQIIKIEFEGTDASGSGTITFSGYNQDKVVEKPSDYSIESELIN